MRLAGGVSGREPVLGSQPGSLRIRRQALVASPATRRSPLRVAVPWGVVASLVVCAVGGAARADFPPPGADPLSR